MPDIIYWHAINCLSKIGPRRFSLLYSHFNTMEAAWKAGKSELSAAGIDTETARYIIDSRKKINPEALFAALSATKIRVVTIRDKIYPALLLTIADPPPVLYYRGALPNNNDFLIAVVGSRKHSSYGKRCTEVIVKDLAREGIKIVSGLAIGIDAIAHTACLENNTPTFGIVPGGVDKIYPACNSGLANRIIRCGGIISEFPPQSTPAPHAFHQRNRIISGLARGVVVIESGLKSGTRITAAHALEQNREVFAVPGNIFSVHSRGCNKLIQEGGAKLVASAEEIMDEFKSFVPRRNKLFPKTPARGSLTDTQQQIAVYLGRSGATIDKLVRLTKLETNVVLSNISEMEILGIINRSGNDYYLNI